MFALFLIPLFPSLDVIAGALALFFLPRYPSFSIKEGLEPPSPFSRMGDEPSRFVFFLSSDVAFPLGVGLLLLFLW